MEKSESIKEIAKALLAFQEKGENVKKDGNNPYFKSKYATLENILDTIKPTLAKCGLSFSQFPDGEGLTTILMHTSGEFLKANTKMTLRDQTPQGQGSAITYMRRYALSAVLGIATEEDDDGNAASQPAPKPTGGKFSTTKTDAQKRKSDVKEIQLDSAKTDAQGEEAVEFIEQPPIEV